MKNFKNFDPEKYASSLFTKVEDGIYRTKDPYGIGSDDCFVTSLTFEHEPDMLGEEHGSPQYISQTPFEDILDEFCVYVTDFFDELNADSETVCYQEFGSSDIEDIKKLRTIIGKRVYAKPINDEGYYKLVIE